MTPRLFKKVGKCQNCKCEEELEVIIINGKEKEFCDACADGYAEETKKE